MTGQNKSGRNMADMGLGEGGMTTTVTMEFAVHSVLQLTYYLTSTQCSLNYPAGKSLIRCCPHSCVKEIMILCCHPAGVSEFFIIIMQELYIPSQSRRTKDLTILFPIFTRINTLPLDTLPVITPPVLPFAWPVPTFT